MEHSIKDLIEAVCVLEYDGQGLKGVHQFFIHFNSCSYIIQIMKREDHGVAVVRPITLEDENFIQDVSSTIIVLADQVNNEELAGGEEWDDMLTPSVA